MKGYKLRNRLTWRESNIVSD